MAAGSHKAVSSCWFSQDTVRSPHTPPTPPAVAEVKLFNNHCAGKVPHRWLPPKEQQSVAGFRGRRDAAVPIWLRKQLWGLICPTRPQRRGCNSIASWPTVLPLAGSAAQALLKKKKAPLRKCPSERPVEQKACGPCNSQSALPHPPSSLLNISSFIQRSITEAT